MRGLFEEVRHHCAAIAAGAQDVSIDLGADVPAGGIAGLDPELHLLDAPAEERALYVLVLDTLNFGSGWFGELAIPAGQTGTEYLTRRLTEHFRRAGAPDPGDIAEILGQDPAHELMRLYGHALRQLAAWLGGRRALEAVDIGSAERLARALADGMPFFADRGFYKRAQITANDLVLAGVADYRDIDRLTIFADNLVPHVLRAHGVLRYSEQLAALVDAGKPLQQGGRPEIEIRACAVHACEALAARMDVAPRVLDNWLWNRGERLPDGPQRPHVARTVFY